MSSPGAGADGWRQCIGRVGVWVGPGALEQDPGGFAAWVEHLGYGALWVGGSNPGPKSFDLLDRALSGSGRLVVATGITSIWAWEPLALARRVAALEAAHPGRFVLGLGVSHAPAVQQLGRRYERPLEAMTRFPHRPRRRRDGARDGRELVPAAQGAGSLRAGGCSSLPATGPRGRTPT